MTIQDLINYYANLLILQYIGQPKAYAHIQTLVTPAIMDQLPLLVQNAFDVNTAVGVQLDVLGKYVGVTRNAFTFTGPVTLDDGDFRLLIKMQILQNSAGSSLADIQNLISIYFPGSLRVFDFKNMNMGYFFDSNVGSRQLAEVFVHEGVLPKPMGVQLEALIYAPDLDNIFGFRTYEIPPQLVTGFQSYTDYQTNRPWLRYFNAIIA